ncbi:hypothetical protein ACFY5K_06755 [Streptomyces griseofuscus]|nr:hypothetical protein [Streptomyces sp. CRPSP2-6A1]MBJ7000803.1 hypothetical protein [Streptomyces sp. CRPSP2-6A1]
MGVLLLAGASVSAVFLLRKGDRTTAVGTLAGLLAASVLVLHLLARRRGN